MWSRKCIGKLKQMWINFLPCQGVCMKPHVSPAQASVTAWKVCALGHDQAYCWVRSISSRTYHNPLLFHNAPKPTTSIDLQVTATRRNNLQLIQFNTLSADAAWPTPNCYCYSVLTRRILTCFKAKGFLSVQFFLQPPFTATPTITCLQDLSTFIRHLGFFPY